MELLPYPISVFCETQYRVSSDLKRDEQNWGESSII